MALTKETKVLGINDAKMSKLTADDEITLTYEASIDVPGITQLEVSPNFIEKELRGDEKVIDTYTKLDYIEWKFENAKISLDALAILLGGTVTTSGTTPNQVQTYTLTGNDIPAYFKLEAKADYTDAGDVHIVLYKCKANKVSYTLKGEEYATVSASGRAIATVKDDKVKDVVINETAVDIA